MIYKTGPANRQSGLKEIGWDLLWKKPNLQCSSVRQKNQQQKYQMGNNWQGGSSKGKSRRHLLNFQLIPSCQCQVTGKKAIILGCINRNIFCKPHGIILFDWQILLCLLSLDLGLEFQRKIGQLERSYREAVRCLITITYRNRLIYCS